MQTLTLIRGLPGAGKSTLASELVSREPNTKHFEADMFFVEDGMYRFDKSKLNGAHKWCLIQTMLSIIYGYNVVVSNTFTTKKELEPYIEITKGGTVQLRVIELKSNYGSIHGVPPETIHKMSQRWENYEH